MKNKLLKKSDIPLLLKAAHSDYDIYAPVRQMGEDLNFVKLPKAVNEFDKVVKDVSLADKWIVAPPKEIFFPQLEAMLEFENSKVGEMVDSSPKLLFGLKACDLKGILFDDDFYSRNFDDKYYLSRKRKRLTVVAGCVCPPRPKCCFCTSAKTGPFLESGFDLQLVEIADSYFVEVGSKEGEGFVNKHAKFFKDADSRQAEQARDTKKKGFEAVELKVDFQKALDMMADNDFVPEENYQRIAERCIYCGACLYLCPTCTCFNVFDTAKDKKGLRYRNWDACVFEGYTREASGHNPRAKKWLRTSRRYEHKLKYDYKQTGMSGCVACGRCLASCPVELGISKFIQEITENKKLM